MHDLIPDKNFASGGSTRAEDGLEQFGPAGADQSRQYQDFAAAKDQRNVGELTTAAEMAQFEQRLADRADTRSGRLRRAPLIAGDQRHDVLTIQPIDERRDFFETVTDVDNADARLR